MILTLKNFKCFTYAKFKFEDESNVLITAPSGYGKSTIFEAIKFVLWGNRDSDLISFGKKKCEVTLEYKGCIFKRTKNPNYLSIVSEKHGTIEEPQNYLDIHFSRYYQNFISLHGYQQMQILEKISSNQNVDELKDKIKILMQQGNKKITELKTSINVLSKTLENMPSFKDLEKPKEPLDILQYNIKLEKCKELKTKEKEISVNNKINEQFTKELKRIKVPDIGCILDKYKTPLESHDEVKKLLSKLIEKNNEFVIKSGRIKELQKKLIPGVTSEKITELSEKINTQKNLLFCNKSIVKNINALWVKCENVTKTSDVEKIKEIISKNDTNTHTSRECPNCKIPLRIEGNKLVPVCSSIHHLKEIVNLHSKICETENVNLLEKEYLKALASIDSQKSIDEIKLNETVDVKMLLTDISQLEKYCVKIEEKNNMIKRINSTPFTPQKEIDEIMEEIKELELSVKTMSEYSKELDNWKNNEKIKNVITNHKLNLENDNKKLELALKLLENIETLKSLIEVAQNKSLKSLITIINKQVSEFCSCFFNDDIIVKFEEFKQIQSTKIIKPLINLTVIHKGIPMKINNLSSGEYARVKLAVDLIIYKLINTKCPLLLDEETANLDSEISTQIYNKIISQFSDKTILIIAHQAIEGIFNNVMNEDYFSTRCKKLI